MAADAFSFHAAFVPSVASSSSRCTHHHPSRTHSFALTATSSNNDDNNNSSSGSTSKSSRERGIYARPSAAIEKGSGFFIPGLEGSRIRFLFGITVLLADVANHVFVGSQPGDVGQIVAEGLSAFYGALLLLQGSIELGVEKGLALGGGGGTTNNSDEGITSGDGNAIVSNVGNGGSKTISDALQENESATRTIQRMAKTIIAYTPATKFRFLSEDLGVLYSFGIGNQQEQATDIIDTNEQKRLAKLALDAVSASKGGRVALPSDHPASKLLPDNATRCILVQKVNGFNNGSQQAACCVIIGSDKLLPSFTKNDLRWIGQLADYNNMMGAMPV